MGMTTRYFKEFSRELDREMEFKVFGDGGKLCLAFPPQNGRFYDFENFGMVDTLRPWLDSGRLLLVCVDSIDGETWSNESGAPRQRIELHERWFRYVTHELLPRARELGPTEGKAMVTGCSMGGVHAGNFFFRRPDLFDTVISLSGLFHADYFFHDYMDDLVYDNSPLHFLRNMPADHPYMDLYRQSRIILCVGQGAWEDDLLDGTRRMDALLREKGIPAWVDYWGFDVSHDWCWWQKQLPYFFGKIMP
jgi:esterase/lipase superfamily enzyme